MWSARQPNQQDQTTPRPNRRLGLFIIVLSLHQFISIMNWLRSPILAESIRLSPVFEIITGAIWVIVFTTLAISLWRSFATTRQVIVLLTIFSLFQILRLAAFAQADYDRQRLPFLVLLWFAWVIILFLIELISTVQSRRLADHTGEHQAAH